MSEKMSSTLGSKQGVLPRQMLSFVEKSEHRAAQADRRKVFEYGPNGRFPKDCT